MVGVSPHKGVSRAVLDVRHYMAEGGKGGGEGDNLSVRPVVHLVDRAG